MAGTKRQSYNGEDTYVRYISVFRLTKVLCRLLIVSDLQEHTIFTPAVVQNYVISIERKMLFCA